MTAAEALQAALDVVRAPARKKGIFGRGRNRDAGKKRLEAARALAGLAETAPADARVLEGLELAAAEFPGESTVRLAYARALGAAGRGSDAIAEFEEHLRSHNDDRVALANVASQYEAAGREDLAIERLQRAVDACVKEGDLDAAVAAAHRLISLEPASLGHATDLVTMLRARDPGLLADALEHLADVYRDRGKMGLEAEACRDALAVAPDRALLRARLADLCSHIVEIDPEDADAWAGLDVADPSLAAELRTRMQLPDATKEAPEHLAGGGEEPHDAYAVRKAQELIEAGDVHGASLCLERAARSDPAPATHLALARCYLAAHRPDDALRASLRAIALACVTRDAATVDVALGWLLEARPEAAATVGDAVFLSGRPESADILYEELLRMWDESNSVLEETAQAGQSE